MPTLRATTREGHRALHKLITTDFAVSFDAARLVRSRGAPGATRGRIAAAPATNYVMFLGVRFRAHEAAHVLRVGPDGPLWPSTCAAPADGDWTNVHPDNWPHRAQVLGTAGRAAAARARDAALVSGLLRAAPRPGDAWFAQHRWGGGRSVLSDARYWWSKQVGAAGDTDPTLSVEWRQARQHAPRHWAVCHHLAHRATELLAQGPAGDRAALVGDVQAALLQERADIYRDAGRLAQVTAWAAKAAAAGDIHDTPEQAGRIHRHRQTDAAAPEPAQAPADDGGLY